MFEGGWFRQANFGAYGIRNSWGERYYQVHRNLRYETVFELNDMWNNTMYEYLRDGAIPEPKHMAGMLAYRTWVYYAEA